MNARSTDRKAHADASSSLNVRAFVLQESLLIVLSKEQVSSEVMKISSDSGLAFFIRIFYLKIVKPEQIVENAEFFGEDEKDIVDAGFAFAAESKAVEYLARSEQSRFGLSKKLANKNYERKFIEMALGYLEFKNYLSDERFARAWLNSRRINHSEGRSKLAAELASRGISKETAKVALDEFFLENSEIELCRKDFAKISKNCADSEKIIRRLISHGFSYSMIKKVISGDFD